MKHSTKFTFQKMTIAALCAGVGLLASAQAAAFPNKPVQIVVPFAAGGGTDITTRAMQEPMKEALGTNVVTKNTAGAGGTIGVAEAARARPDGYVLAMAPVGPLTTQPHLQSLPYDVDSFEYVCLAYSAPSIITVSKDAPYNDLEELVTYAKDNPGEIMIAIDAIGSIPHVASLALAEEADIDVDYLPVDGNGPALKALLDGTADVFVAHQSFLAQNLEQLKGLALLQPEPLESMPNLKTAKEQGFDLDFPIWGGLVAPVNTPEDVVVTLDDACHTAVASDGFQKRMEQLGQPSSYMSSADFDEFVRAQYERNKKLLHSAGFETK